MKKLEFSDIQSIEAYNEVRDDFRARLIAIKEPRRIAVGPYLSFLFENRDTMLYQVQEMCRVENIRKAEAIRHEVETYNQLVPGPHELRATLLIEFNDPVVRAVKLNELLGLEKHVSLVGADFQTHAVFDDNQMDEERLSSVQYIHFPLGKEAAETLLVANQVDLVTTHPACSYRQTLSVEQLAALRADLQSG